MTGMREISHDEASDIAMRLISNAWRYNGDVHSDAERHVESMPRRPDLDDDCLIQEYIWQHREKVTAKRYLVFAFDHNYPDGGYNDLVGRVDTVAEVIPAVIAKYPNWSMDAVHVIDAWTDEVTVYKGTSFFGVKPSYALVEDAGGSPPEALISSPSRR